MNILCSPNTRDVEKYLKDKLDINKKTLHIVPTKILERRRRSFYKSQLKLIDERFQNINYYNLTEIEQGELFKSYGIYIYEIHSFFEDFLLDYNIKHLTRRESSVYLERSLKEFDDMSNKPWMDNVSGILDFFTQIKIGRIDYKRITPAINNLTWHNLTNVLQVYNEMLEAESVIDKADAYLLVLQKLKEKYFDNVYIDGAFLPIPPLLSQLIKEFSREQVNFFIPYDLEKKGNLKFKVLEQTYSTLLPIEKWKNIKDSDKSINLIHRIANNLFEDKQVMINDRTLSIKKYSSAEEEIRNVVNEISMYISESLIPPEKIAIVSTKPMQLRKQVNEYLEIYDLYENKIEKQLIDFPIGKIIYILYQIYIDDRIGLFNNENHYIDDVMVSDLLHVTEITEREVYYDTFNKLKVFFSECLTFSDWYKRLKQLIKAKELDLHLYKEHPLNFVEKEDIESLKGFLKIIESASSYIINQDEKAFKDHLNRLFELINNKVSFKKLFIESDIHIFEQKIKEFSQSQIIAENIPITSNEFGNRIHTILTEVKDVNKIDESPIDKITVTGPNNIEFQEYEKIYLVQFTQTKFPEKHIYTWPFNDEFDWIILNHSKNSFGLNVNSMYEYYTYRSLYYFYITLNSTDKKLIITYSEKYDSNISSPSHLLFDIAKLLIPDKYKKIIGSEIDFEKPIKKELEKIGLLINPSSAPKGKAYDVYIPNYFLKANSSISIEELIIYKQCPRQYYYLKKYDNYNYYNDRFQLFHYAIGCMYEKTVQMLVKKQSTIEFNSSVSKEFLKKDFDRLYKQAKEKIGLLFLLPFRDREDIYLRVKYLYHNLIDYIFKQKGTTKNTQLYWNEKVNQIKVSNTLIEGKKDLTVKHPDNKGKDYYISLFKYISFDKNKRNELRKLQTKFHNNDKKEEVIQEVNDFFVKISNNQFEKKHGDHCMYCKFKYWCLGNEVSK